MRILHLISHLSAGGAERQLGYLAPEMAKAGNQVHIGYIYDGPECPPITGVKLHKIRLLGNHDFRLVIKVRKLIRTFKPNIIQSWIQNMDIVVGVISHWEDAIWIMREPTTLEAYINPTLKQKLRLHLAARANAIICNSAGGLAYWHRNGVNENSLHLIPNAIAIDMMKGSKPPMNVGPRDKTLIYAGRLISSKNVDTLIKAFAEIRQRQNVYLVVAGEGPEERNLIKLVDHLDMKGAVRFLGHVRSHKLRNLMLEADAFISLSYYEGMPNSVCEAAACKTPLILSDIPSHRALFNEESAFFVPVDSVTKIADTVSHVLKDKEKAGEKAARALLATKALDPTTVARQYLDVYKMSLDRAGAN